MEGRVGGWIPVWTLVLLWTRSSFFCPTQTSLFCQACALFSMGNSYLADDYVRCTINLIHNIATGFHPRLFILYFLTLQYMYDLYITFAFSSLLKGSVSRNVIFERSQLNIASFQVLVDSFQGLGIRTSDYESGFEPSLSSLSSPSSPRESFLFKDCSVGSGRPSSIR